MSKGKDRGLYLRNGKWCIHYEFQGQPRGRARCTTADLKLHHA